MNTAVLKPEVQKFLRERLQEPVAALALIKSPFPDVSSADLAQQLDGLKRSQKKLPLWHKTPGIYFPIGLSLEQASSALTGQYKSTLIPQENTLIDLTGGFGVDSYYFSKKAKAVTYCERQEELAIIAEHNANSLGAKRIKFIVGDGVEYLQQHPALHVDYIYLDPSRRVKQQRVFLLSDCEPNVIAQLKFFFSLSRNILVKAAPLLDIHAALQELQQVKEVHVVSVQNECKELLFLLERDFLGEPRYHCAAIKNTGEIAKVSFTRAQELESEVSYAPPQKFLYEPDAALLKAGGFRYIAHHFKLAKLQQHTHLYTSNHLDTRFIGRSFEVIKTQAYGAFKKQKQNLQANVSVRNFPLKPEVLKKKHKIKDGGEDYLFFCTLADAELAVIYCRKTRPVT